MDPLYEQRLREEVIFLHSLWHQGPPRPPAAAVTAAAAASTSNSATRYHLQPSKPTKFKKKRKGKKILPNNAPPDSGGVEWPCPATPPPTECGPTPEPPALSPEEQSKSVSRRLHHHALKAVREFFTSYDSDGFDVIESSDDDDDDDDDDEEYSILFKVFEDTKLKEYYAKNFAMGEFSCLVCGAVGGKNAAKKFRGCLPLVQHSIAIEKTKRRGAHRAFAQAVCKVLGWDIDCLHEIVSMLSDNKSGNAQGNGNGDKEESAMAFVHDVDSVKDDGKDDEAEPESDAGKNLEEPASDVLTTSFSACNDADKTEIQVHSGGDVSAVSTSSVVPMQPSEAGWTCPSPPHLPSTSDGSCKTGEIQISLIRTDANKNLENLEMVCQQSMEEPASQGLAINSSVHPDADKVENLGMEHQHNVQQPASEGPKIVGDEMQEVVQMN